MDGSTRFPSEVFFTVNVFLPKIKITGQFDLKEVLRSMGISDAFDDNRADFSGVTGDKDLALSALIHKTFLDINEEGCEASAATSVKYKLVSCCSGGKKPKPLEFEADHPFLFIILHKPTKAILFMGRLVDPSK